MVTRYLLIIIAALTSMGFDLSRQFYIRDGWEITREKPDLWIHFDRSIADTPFTSTAFKNNDLLQGVIESNQRSTLIDLTLANFNKLTTSYVALHLHPDNDDQYILPASTTVPFDESQAENRTIHITVGATGLESGSALVKMGGDTFVTSCSIEMDTRTLADAYVFKKVLTHELGHCLGLNHVHEDHDAIMGYNSSRHDLGIDEKQGLTYLYPSSPNFAREQPSLGLGCVRENI